MRAKTGMVVLVAALVVLPQTPVAGGTPELAGPIAAEVLRVVDGDTLTVRARIWIGQEVETNVRVEGIDTPELRSRCVEERALAREARDHLEHLVGGGPVMLTAIQPDKYGNRVRARVHTTSGTDIAAALIKAGLARPYQGEKRAGWCAESQAG